MRLKTFSGDFDELARLVETEWGAKYGQKTRFRYGAPWLASFFGREEAKPELLVEYRDADGTLSGFVGAAPRRALVGGRPLRLELITLLTSARHNVGLVAFELLREIHARAGASGVDGTYNCCLEGDRTPDLLGFVAKSLRLRVSEIAAVPSLMGLARPAAANHTVDVRPASPDDAPPLAALFSRATRGLSVGRAMTEGDFRATIASPDRRVVVLARDAAPIGFGVYERRHLVGGTEVTEVANVDLIVAPDATPAESRGFVGAIASEAAASGATMLLGYERPPEVFPHARAAGLRIAPRTLRVFVVAFGQTPDVAAGTPHLLEIE